MAELIGLIDTGVLCCWLEVPGKETAGSANDLWNNGRANIEIDAITKKKGTLILPNSVIIETANHIAQSPHSRKLKAQQLFKIILQSINGTKPWRRFEETDRLWTKVWFDEAADKWPLYAERRIGLADYSIANIAYFFQEFGAEVLTLTTDALLRAEVGHLAPSVVKRRRR